MLGNTLYYGDSLDILRAFGMSPTNITLAQAQRVEPEANQGVGHCAGTEALPVFTLEVIAQLGACSARTPAQISTAQWALTPAKRALQ